jgi:hypothetical protein
MSSAVPPDDFTQGRSEPAGQRPPAEPSVRPTEPSVRPTAVETDTDGRSSLDRQKERFGGMKFGATFFGWLAAAGAGVLMTALLASLGAGIGLSSSLNPDQVTGNAGTMGIISAVVLLVVIFIAYFCGGYVAGRMARFNGLKQGVGVWLWAIIAAVVVAVLAAITGNQINASRYLNGGPQIPVSREALTASGIIAALAVLVVALVGAIVGGLSGMRFHRRVDRAIS